MQVTVRLLASYRRYQPQGCEGQVDCAREVPPGTRVGDLLADLAIPPAEVYTFLVNGRHAGRDQILQAGDIISLFPAVGGG
jgi:sulfur carrier protein ThiS